MHSGAIWNTNSTCLRIYVDFVIVFRNILIINIKHIVICCAMFYYFYVYYFLHPLYLWVTIYYVIGNYVHILYTSSFILLSVVVNCVHVPIRISMHKSPTHLHHIWGGKVNMEHNDSYLSIIIMLSWH